MGGGAPADPLCRAPGPCGATVQGGVSATHTMAQGASVPATAHCHGGRSGHTGETRAQGLGSFLVPPKVLSTLLCRDPSWTLRPQRSTWLQTLTFLN